jgi:hypothetical protein
MRKKIAELQGMTSLAIPTQLPRFCPLADRCVERQHTFQLYWAQSYFHHIHPRRGFRDSHLRHLFPLLASEAYLVHLAFYEKATVSELEERRGAIVLLTASLCLLREMITYDI